MNRYRWKDVNQHWNSLCKLLQETLLRLEATYAEVRHVLQIRREEFDWLDNCEHVGYMRRPIRGNLDTVQEEIESHEVRVDEIVRVAYRRGGHWDLPHLHVRVHVA